MLLHTVIKLIKGCLWWERLQTFRLLDWIINNGLLGRFAHFCMCSSMVMVSKSKVRHSVCIVKVTKCLASLFSYQLLVIIVNGNDTSSLGSTNKESTLGGINVVWSMIQSSSHARLLQKQSNCIGKDYSIQLIGHKCAHSHRGLCKIFFSSSCLWYHSQNRYSVNWA